MKSILNEEYPNMGRLYTHAHVYLNNSKFEIVTNFTSKMMNCNLCIIKITSMMISCKSDIKLFTIYHQNSYENFHACSIVV